MLELKTYKNWKEICEAMGWDTTGGNTKKSYLKKLESLCSYDKLGNKFVIKEIYDTPKEIEDGRGKSEGSRGNNNPYSTNIEDIIIHELSTTATMVNDVKWIVSKGQLMTAVGLCNENFSSINFNVDLFSEELGIHKDYLKALCNDFFGTTRTLLERKLKKLQDNCEILVDKNKHNVVKNGKHTLATDKEEAFILDITKQALKELNCSSRNEVFYKSIVSLFDKKIEDSLKNNKYGIESFYSVYVIVAGSDFRKKILEHTEEIRKDTNKVKYDRFEESQVAKNEEILAPYINSMDIANKRTNGERVSFGKRKDEDEAFARTKELDLFLKYAIDLDCNVKFYVNKSKVEIMTERGKEWKTVKTINRVTK